MQAWASATASRYLALDYTVNSSTLIYLIVITLIAAVVVVLCRSSRLCNWVFAAPCEATRVAPRRTRAGSALPRHLSPARWHSPSFCCWAQASSCTQLRKNRECRHRRSGPGSCCRRLAEIAL